MEHTFKTNSSKTIYAPVASTAAYCSYILSIRDEKHVRNRESLVREVKLLNGLSYNSRSDIAALGHDSRKAIHDAILKNILFSNKTSSLDFTMDKTARGKMVRRLNTEEEVRYACCLQSLVNSGIILTSLPKLLQLNIDYFLDIDSLIIEIKNFLMSTGGTMVHFLYRLKSAMAMMDSIYAGDFALDSFVPRELTADNLKKDLGVISYVATSIDDKVVLSKLKSIPELVESKEIKDLLEEAVHGRTPTIIEA